MKAQRVNRLKNVEDSNNAFNFGMKQAAGKQVVLSSKRDHSRRQKTFMECSKDDYNKPRIGRVTPLYDKHSIQCSNKNECTHTCAEFEAS